MLINCYLNTYVYFKQYLPKIGTIFLLSICFSSICQATTQNYRLTLTETPSSALLIGWELIGGCPDLQRVYYDTVDHGQDTAAYAFQSTITASNFHQGMENYFCHLKELQPDTEYYLVIGEDEGISPRLIAQTLSSTKAHWQGGWISPELVSDLKVWSQLAQQSYKEALDFVILDGLVNLNTEDDWRKWLDAWQPSTYEKKLIPIVAASWVSPDAQYLLNISDKKLRHYPIASQSTLLITESAKVKKRFWKSISDSSLVIWYSSKDIKKLSEKVDLALINADWQESSPPNTFHFPSGQDMVVLEKTDEKLQIRSLERSLLFEMFLN
ncbi:MAG: fibronectin type III domain-containing protein [Bacteroidota bacterium]